MSDAENPLAGWFFAHVQRTNAGNASMDIYGKLYVHIYSRLLLFIQRLSNTGVNFEIRNLDATELPKALAPTKFARIDVWYNPQEPLILTLTH